MTPSRRVGPYVLLEELGAGAMGRVFRARHEPTGAVRAVKVLATRNDLEILARFDREARALARVEGEGIVPVHDAGDDQGTRWIAMALLEGGSLRDKLRSRGKLEWSEASAIVARAARAVGRCHAVGIVHRDLKPENLLFDAEGRLHVADFGVARDLEASRALTETGSVVGTFSYMAPEQLEGKPASARADVYALGVILHELVTGDLPFPSGSVFQAIQERRGRRPRLSLPLADRVLDRALAWSPADRWEDGGALADAIEGKGGGRRFPILALVALALGGLGLAALAPSRPRPTPLPAPPAPIVSSSERSTVRPRLTREEATRLVRSLAQKDDFEGAATVASESAVAAERTLGDSIWTRAEALAVRSQTEDGDVCIRDFERAYAGALLARRLGAESRDAHEFVDAGKTALLIFLSQRAPLHDSGLSAAIGVQSVHLCEVALELGVVDPPMADRIMCELTKGLGNEELPLFLVLRERFKAELGTRAKRDREAIDRLAKNKRPNDARAIATMAFVDGAGPEAPHMGVLIHAHRLDDDEAWLESLLGAVPDDPVVLFLHGMHAWSRPGDEDRRQGVDELRRAVESRSLDRSQALKGASNLVRGLIQLHEDDAARECLRDPGPVRSALLAPDPQGKRNWTEEQLDAFADRIPGEARAVFDALRMEW